MSEDWKAVQRWAGVADDGIPGPATARAILARAGLVSSRMDGITARVACELIAHEAIVLEWYKDSEGVGTWGIGVTNASEHNVDRYKDNPQTVEHVIEVYLWLLRNKYLPGVLEAFKGRVLTEEQLAAALSFHYNTGAIKTTAWVNMWLGGDVMGAKKFWLTHYLNGGKLAARRAAEVALFFNGEWSNRGTTIIWPVKKPSYTPDWSRPRQVDIRQAVEAAL